MKKFFGILVLVFMLGACVSVDIKTEIPEISFFDISFGNELESAKNKSAQTYGIIFASSMPYDSTDIFKLDSQSLQLKALPNMQWATKPRDMLSSSLVGMMNAQGFNVARAPFGSAKLAYTLKIHIDRILIVQKGSEQYAAIALHFELIDTKDLRPLKNGIITQEALIEGKEFAPIFAQVSKKVLEDLLAEISK
ncbi:hypothetical protein [Helicobacter himalayensis]|uniref:hypothetical protein n=1 Tax=Helicobacter himalayensis TaxID=1591088 RepID=UPI00082DAE23|nr:hypothetical protein [Helicobacter himalayensis]